MKNLLTYISKDKKFNDEHLMAAKIQIDNSLELWWKPSDILLVTNFDFEYNGVKSIVIDDGNYCDYHFPATKVYVINYLFKHGFIKNYMYWYHDFDCFQLNRLIKPDFPDMGVTNYGRMPRICSASMFFKKSASDIFQRIQEKCDSERMGEEEAIMKLINGDTNLQQRVKLLNITYAMHKFNFGHCYARAIKPIQAVHFHLTPDKYDFYVNGNNRAGLSIIPDHLIYIFNQHGFHG
jgi:hypothetical protein